MGSGKGFVGGIRDEELISKGSGVTLAVIKSDLDLALSAIKQLRISINQESGWGTTVNPESYLKDRL